MKAKISMITIIIFAVAAMFTCCEKGGETGKGEDGTVFELSKKEIKLTNLDTPSTVNITSDGVWTIAVSSPDDWLSATPLQGEGDGTFRVWGEDNTEGSARTGGKVIVSRQIAGVAVTKEIAVEQLGAEPGLLLEYSKTKVPFWGAKVSVTVISNIPWDVSIPEEHEELVTFDKASSDMSATPAVCKFDIAANRGMERNLEVTFFSTSGYQLSKNAVFTQQESEAVLNMDRVDYILPFRHPRLRIPVDVGGFSTNYTIEVPTEAQGWINWDKDASNASEIVLTLVDNDQSDMPRDAEITVRNVTLSKNVKIFQYGKPNPRIGDDTSAQPLAFPGAEGGGRFTTGGRGGVIYRVTNLEDYANNETPIQGSLRYGVEYMTGARTIIFDVSGIIELKRRLSLQDTSNLSIIGQTAPGDGITLKDWDFSFNLSEQSKTLNAIIRFLRVRPGDRYADYQEDGMGGRYFTDAIVDHVTASWSVDETLSFYGCQNFTAQWCIASESLNISNHDKGAHGYGSMMSGDNASYHHILLAHHGSRVPRISDMPDPGTQGAGDHIGFFDVRNNVYYNWSEGGFGCYGGKNGTFNIADCYYKAGPATGTGSMSWRVVSSDPTARAYINGNYVTASAVATADNWETGVWSQFWRDLHPTRDEMEAMKMDTPRPFSKVTGHTAQQAYEKVLQYAGASLYRDVIDQRIVNEVRTKTSSKTGSAGDNPRPGIIDTVGDTEGYPEVKSLPAWPDTDSDGIPDIWEDAYGLNKNSASDAAAKTVDNMGRYSNLEVYFHNLVQHIVYAQNLDGIPVEGN